MNDFAHMIDRKLGYIPQDKEGLRLWLKLSTLVQLLETDIRKHLAAQYSMTLPRFEVLAALERVPEGLTMVDLSKWLMVTKGNITGIAERLSEDGFIRRTPTPSDLRTFCVTLTPKGRSIITEMLASYELLLNSAFEEVSQEEMDGLLGVFNKVKENISARED